MIALPVTAVTRPKAPPPPAPNERLRGRPVGMPVGRSVGIPLGAPPFLPGPAAQTTTAAEAAGTETCPTADRRALSTHGSGDQHADGRLTGRRRRG